MKKLSLLVVVLFAGLNMFATVNPVVKFNIDKGKLTKVKKSVNKKDVSASKAIKGHSIIASPCPDEFTVIIDLDAYGNEEVFLCEESNFENINYRTETTYDDLYFLYAKLYNSICMVDFDGLLASWVVTTVVNAGECP